MTAVGCVVLDAMGVIFDAADDVAELLIPFIGVSGGSIDHELIRSRYIAASLGTISPDDFWFSVGLDASVEDAYLKKHSLVRGALEFLRDASNAGVPVWCLSNDIDRWSRKLRASFDIERLLTGAVISSDVKARKPGADIYRCLLHRSGHRAADMLFVDDRADNVFAARNLGIHAIRFGANVGYGEVAKAVFGKSV